MIKKDYSNIDVVTASKQRIKNIFNSAEKVELSLSGGKDSICLNDMVYKLCSSGEVDKNKLVVDFIDEEAIYPCVEKIVKKMRLQWIQIGVEFRWWCIEVKHYNCFNMLENDESFICWDRYKESVWIRRPPSFALRDHPLLNNRKDKYQDFLPRLNRGRISMQGVRCSESMQRMNVMAVKKQPNIQWPIYDWTDKDVWLYIKENSLEIPDAYMYMWQVGVPANRLRISQFFSIDTSASLVQMCEYYPDLFNKICKREPNAYLAMLYYDTEMFRRKKEGKRKQPDNVDYKAKVLNLLNNDAFFTTPSKIETRNDIKRLVVMHGTIMTNDHYKKAYEILLAGDPKRRAFRALFSSIFKDLKVNG